MLAVVAAAQNDFRGTLGRVSEKRSDMSLVKSSLRLMDFDVKVSVGGQNPNILFAERVASSAMSHEQTERMGIAASRAISSSFRCARSESPTRCIPKARARSYGGSRTNMRPSRCWSSPWLAMCRFREREPRSDSRRASTRSPCEAGEKPEQ